MVSEQSAGDRPVSEYRRDRRVEFAETDMAGIVHFAQFFRYVEETEHEFLRSLGLGVDREVDGEKLGFPRIAARCDFRRPLRFEDVVSIELRIRRIGVSSITYQFLLTHDDHEIARAEITASCCYYGSGGFRRVPLPSELTDRIAESSLEPLEFGPRAGSTRAGPSDTQRES